MHSTSLGVCRTSILFENHYYELPSATNFSNKWRMHSQVWCCWRCRRKFSSFSFIHSLLHTKRSRVFDTLATEKKNKKTVTNVVIMRRKPHSSFLCHFLTRNKKTEKEKKDRFFLRNRNAWCTRLCLACDHRFIIILHSQVNNCVFIQHWRSSSALSIIVWPINVNHFCFCFSFTVIATIHFRLYQPVRLRPYACVQNIFNGKTEDHLC